MPLSYSITLLHVLNLEFGSLGFVCYLFIDAWSLMIFNYYIIIAKSELIWVFLGLCLFILQLSPLIQTFFDDFFITASAGPVIHLPIELFR